MASIRKAGRKWLAEIRVKGKKPMSKTHGTKAQAAAWAQEEEYKIRNSSGVVRGKSLGEAFRKYAQEESPKKRTARWEGIRLKKLGRDAIASAQMADLSADDFDAWIRRQEKAGLKSSSIRRELQVISSVLTKARKRWKWLGHNPLELVELPKKLPPRDKCINEEEKARILAALGYHDGIPVTTTRQKIAVAFLLAIETAMRQGELWKMDWKDVNWEQCYVRLPETKNGTERDVPLSAIALELLCKLGPKSEGRVITCAQASAVVIYRRAVERAGYKNKITFHDTRHTAVTHLALKLDMLTLARMVGHKDPRNLMVYYNPTSKSIADRLNGKAPALA